MVYKITNEHECDDLLKEKVIFTRHKRYILLYCENCGYREKIHVPYIMKELKNENNV